MESDAKVARTCEKLSQGVRGELLHRQLGYEGQLKGRVRRVRAFSVTMGGGKLSRVSREHTDGESWTREYVEL